jgi:hypothetical protein
MAARLRNPYLRRMGSWWSKALVVALALALGHADLAHAGPKKSRAERALEWGVPNIMVEEGASGTPIIMQDLPKRPKASVPDEHAAAKGAERPRRFPRGSSAYVTPIPLPRTGGDPGIVASPPVTPYIPPPLDNPSERINQLNHSFPLNRGLGLNPTDRDAYIRYNLTR